MDQRCHALVLILNHDWRHPPQMEHAATLLVHAATGAIHIVDEDDHFPQSVSKSIERTGQYFFKAMAAKIGSHAAAESNRELHSELLEGQSSSGKILVLSLTIRRTAN
jgi:hypothetical protein